MLSCKGLNVWNLRCCLRPGTRCPEPFKDSWLQVAGDGILLFLNYMAVAWITWQIHLLQLLNFLCS